jgi:hypothetical protein
MDCVVLTEGIGDPGVLTGVVVTVCGRTGDCGVVVVIVGGLVTVVGGRVTTVGVVVGCVLVVGLVTTVGVVLGEINDGCDGVTVVVFSTGRVGVIEPVLNIGGVCGVTGDDVPEFGVLGVEPPRCKYGPVNDFLRIELSSHFLDINSKVCRT